MAVLLPKAQIGPQSCWIEAVRWDTRSLSLKDVRALSGRLVSINTYFNIPFEHLLVRGLSYS